MELVSVRCFIMQVENYSLVGMRSLFMLILHMLSWKGPSDNLRVRECLPSLWITWLQTEKAWGLFGGTQCVLTPVPWQQKWRS